MFINDNFRVVNQIASKGFMLPFTFNCSRYQNYITKLLEYSLTDFMTDV